ncbi:unnamed protein product [Orchesella dallaii]|uniref:Uncharacterized protein n=1 Tax=Orchesella dallaii TaxID=48710 RepID=A0ABP1PLY4_9HEXA
MAKDPNVDLNDGEDQGDETNQDSSNDDSSGQSENRGRRDSEDEVDNDNGGGNDYDIIDGDKEVGNDSDEGSEGEEQVVLEKADKQKRHLMDSFIPEDGELQKLMSESSDLSKEAEQVFEAISDREVKLLREMELLKNALSMAVSKLKTSLQAEVTELAEKTGRQRRDYNFQKPYKACVSIEPSAPDQQYPGLGQPPSRGAGAYLPKGLGSSPPIPQPPADVREFIPSKGDPLIKPSAPVKRPALPPSSQPRAQVGPRPDQVDLSQVVWLRLHPERKQEELKKKVDLLLKEKQNKGKDVLIIPVNHNLKNTEEVKTEFLHAVRVKPGALKHHNFRQLRSLAVVEY